MEPTDVELMPTIRAWIANAQSFEAWDEVRDIVSNAPAEEAWALIVEMIALAPSHYELFGVAADRSKTSFASTDPTSSTAP